MVRITTIALSLVSILTLRVPSVLAEQLPARYRKAIDKGLAWVAEAQQRDGHWAATGGRYPVAMTALGGMALLGEGSTVREGKYSRQIAKAVDWLMRRSMPNGLIGDMRIRQERAVYMYGHGFALLFLSCAYGGEIDLDRRIKLESVLTRAAKFSRDAQTNLGGWGYVSAKDGANFDEGSVTITQVQALRAARNAGIVVPPQAIKMAVEYLKRSTNPDGGVVYSLSLANRGQGKPALTAAAISCGFSAGAYNSPLVKKWFKFCQRRIQLNATMGHDDYTHYYYAQALCSLGEQGWGTMFPQSKVNDRLTWTRYKRARFDSIVNQQQSNGSWIGQIGPIYRTAMMLTILQLDNAVLPIYQR